MVESTILWRCSSEISLNNKLSTSQSINVPIKEKIDHTQTYICIPYYVGVLWNIEKQLLTVWHKCPSKESLLRRIRVLEENMKFRQIVHTTSQYGQSFFSKTISTWNGLAFLKLRHWLYFDHIFLTISVHPFRIIS